MDEFDRQAQALLQQIETMGDEPAVKLIAAALREAGKREAEHQMFRHQHRDCDAMGIENQHLRAENERLKKAEAEAEKRGMERAANISDRYGSSYFANLIRAEMERKP